MECSLPFLYRDCPAIKDGDADTLIWEWRAAYQNVASRYELPQERFEYFVFRLTLAKEGLKIEEKFRYLKAEPGSHDPSYYEELYEPLVEAREKLDGPFPLGEEETARMAASLFSREEIAMIQLGSGKTLLKEMEKKPSPESLKKQGLIYETEKNYEKALDCYSKLSDYDSRKRLEACESHLSKKGRRTDGLKR